MHQFDWIALFLFFLVMIFTLPACNSSEMDPPVHPNTLTDLEVSEGWELIFDGETLQGWRYRMVPESETKRITMSWALQE